MISPEQNYQYPGVFPASGPLIGMAEQGYF